ncbi:MAG: class I SAM-dependent methyltransferase [Syntrophomonadaceae bacterium]|nr:class I SAM-dependent methyltransferase [Syntrophomonadaceae bacterium]
MVLDPENIKLHFDSTAKHYDTQRRQLIPCFDDFYGTALKLTDISNNPVRVLDLGAGTGLFSEMIAKKHPGISLTLIDLSEEMLGIARQRLQYFTNISYIAGDYLNQPIEGIYDIVGSSLSIHHLSATEKEQLFAKIYALLNPGGIFINADQVLGPDSQMDAFYKREWKETINKSGLSYDELEQVNQRTSLDKMSTLDEQLGWLKRAGFLSVDVVYKSYSFTVMCGKKAQ